MIGKRRLADFRETFGDKKQLIHNTIRKQEKQARLKALREQRLECSQLQNLIENLPSSAQQLHKALQSSPNEPLLDLLCSSQEKLLSVLPSLNFPQYLHMCYILSILTTSLPSPQHLITHSHSLIIYNATQYIALMPMYYNEIIEAAFNYFSGACRYLARVGLVELTNLCHLVTSRLIKYDEEWNREEEMEKCIDVLNSILGNDSRIRPEEEDLKIALDIKRKKFQCIARAFYDDKRVFLTLGKLLPTSDSTLKLLINLTYQIERPEYKSIFYKDLDFSSPLCSLLHSEQIPLHRKSLTIKLINNILQLSVGVPSAQQSKTRFFQSLLHFARNTSCFPLKCEIAETIGNFILEQCDNESVGELVRNNGLNLFESVLNEYYLVNPTVIQTVLESLNLVLRHPSVTVEEDGFSRLISIVSDIYNGDYEAEVLRSCIKILELVRGAM